MADEELWFPGDSLRPERWRALVERPLGRITNAVTRGRLPHAIMVSGPEGMGRELVAVEAAVMIVCRGHEHPWQESPEAQRVRNGSHPDVVALRGEGKKNVIKIESIRRLVQEASGRPFEGLARVWILDAVDASRITTEAANAFLKLLEEPPPHVKFLLLAANPRSALPTIRSRCSHLDLPGAAAAAGLSEEVRAPLEVAHRGESDAEVSSLVAEVKENLLEVLAGDTTAAIRLATRMDKREHAMEIVAAAAIELAAEPDEGVRADRCAELAAEVLETDRIAGVLVLQTQRQLLSILLRWAAGR